MGYKGTPHVSLDIFNYQREKVCNLYDSAIKAKGQAYEIILTTEATGWKEIEFRLPFQVDKEYNHRWDSVKSEYLLRVSLGNKFDWFIIQSPNRSKDSKAITNKVYCAHISSLLKTKNLYLVLDDTNGIGTIRELGSRILAGTGWSLGEVDTLYESDGKTEKVRSLLSEGKSGAHKLLTDLCSLFDAYPEFDGETKVVNLRSMNNKGPLREMMIGKDINSLSVKPNSSDLITRLYIEGEYGDDGYVGIDDVNPTGLTYILNFDYYKEIGLFTEVHQNAYDTYIEQMSATVKSIRSMSKEIAEKENQLNTLWGQPGYALYPVTSGLKLGDPISSYAADQEDVDLKSGDDVYVLGAGTYRKVNVGDTEQVSLVSGDQYVLKLFIPAAGLLGAKEAALDTKKQLVSNLTKDLNNTASEEKKTDIQDQIDKLVSEETDLVNGDGGILDMLSECVTIVTDLDSAYTSRETLLVNQQNIEADFVLVVGDMLKDGYWQNNNYAVGQEKFLFDDGVEVLKSLSRPKVTYTFSRVSLAGQLGYEYAHYDINTQVRVYDKDLGINDIVHVSKTIRYLDDPQKDTVEVTNEDLAMTAQTLDSILSRMADIANLVEQRSSLYDRASAISKDGSIFIDRLNGQINILKNRLSSAVSSWYTDDRGNIIFENTNGRSAMMLTGDGFMIANGKTEDGNWNWRTFGTGEGFTADMIVTGYLSADRIETGSIGSGKLSTEVKNEIDKIAGIEGWVEEAKINLTPQKISMEVVKSTEFSNAVNDAAQSIVAGKTYIQYNEPEGVFSVGDVWIKTNKPDVTWNTLKDLTWEEVSNDIWGNWGTSEEPITHIWDGSSWVVISDLTVIVEMRTSIEQTSDQIKQLATKTELVDGELRKVETVVTQTAEEIKRLATKDEMNTLVIQTADTLRQEANDTEKKLQTSIDQNTREIALKVNKNGVISAINLSSEEAYILAPKIKLEGLVTANSYFKVLTDGSIEATNAVISGKITATSGEIGGWKVDAGKLYSGSGANRVALSTSDATYAIWAGNETAANAPFRVGKNGSLFASNAEITGKIVSTNADITGKITSSSGSIGGWTLATGYIYSGSGTSSVYLSTTDSTYRIWAGNATASSAPFRVGKNGSLYASNAEITGKITSTNADITGKITASSGAIGGWNIGTNLLYAGSGSNRVALSTGDATYAMWAGNETAANAPFRVTKDGKVYLTRVMALANEGDTTPTEVNLSSVSFWKLNRAVKTLSVSDDTLTIALYNGTSVNFKKASSVEYMHISQTGGGSNNVDLTVTAKSKTQEILKSRSISLTCDATNKWVWISSPDDSGSFSGYVNCSEIYDAGEDSVSVNSLSTAYMGYPGNIDVTVKLSNGKSRTITTADGGVFNIGLKAASPTATITYDSSTHKYKIEPYTQYVGDTSVTTGAAKYTGTEAYKAGWDAAVAKIERDGNVIKGPSSTVDEQTNLFTITAGGSLNNITNTAANYFNVNGYAYAYINDINVASKFISKANQINVGQ